MATQSNSIATISSTNPNKVSQKYNHDYITIDNQVHKVKYISECIQEHDYWTDRTNNSIDDWIKTSPVGKWLIENAIMDIFIVRIFNPVTYQPEIKAHVALIERDYTYYQLKWG